MRLSPQATAFHISVSGAAVLDAVFRSRVGRAISTEGGKEVPSMGEDKDEHQEFETVDITAVPDEELDDVAGAGDGSPTK
jgi:hypothetical protein